MAQISARQLFSSFPRPDENTRAMVDRLYREAIDSSKHKIIVLDDDPTGVQTVHSVPVYTDWSAGSITAGFKENSRVVYILTNSRSLTAEKTEKVHKEIAERIIEASNRLGQEFVLISRSDSTLRGHYPLETHALRSVLEQSSGNNIDGEVICPFFKEGGRFTANNIHYVQNGDNLIPAGETEFAGDKTFGYTSSHLGEWIEEKSKGMYRADDVQYISLDSIRQADIDGITKQLLQASGFSKIVVNALDYFDLKVFTIALLDAMEMGKSFLFRTAASFVRIIGGIDEKPLLTRADLIREDQKNGGLIIVGSHVKKTTEQLEALKTRSDIEFIEFNQHLAVDPPRLAAEVDRIVRLCDKSLAAGKTVAVYTRRERLDLNTGNPEDELAIAVRISEAIAGIVKSLSVRPAFLIAKGGITSCDVAVKGLGIRKAMVAGQIRPGIPVWAAGDESKYPGMPYVIFPGNVGTRETLAETVEILADGSI